MPMLNCLWQTSYYQSLRRFRKL